MLGRTGPEGSRQGDTQRGLQTGEGLVLPQGGAAQAVRVRGGDGADLDPAYLLHHMVRAPACRLHTSSTVRSFLGDLDLFNA